MNFTIWIRNGYPFSYDQYDALQTALQWIAGRGVSYNRKWVADGNVDFVTINDCTITTAKQVVNTLFVTHKYQAILDHKYNGNRNHYCRELEIILCKPDEGRPVWAEEVRA